MTDLRAAAQQALEALHYSKVEAITALREALAQPEQEPTCPKCKAAVLYECVACSNNNYPPRPEQEPCIGKDPRCPCQDGDACHYKDCGSTKALPVPVAQPEQEPTPWREMVVVSLVREGIDKHRARELADHFAAQSEQEPVAFYHPRNGFYWAKPTSIFAPTSVDVKRLPLYTAAQRPWVGLTPEEILDLFDRNNVYGSKWIEFARAIEAALRSKNK